jgi:phospholipid/cholesterol/gamma-HCH transport system ATP-binding protein
MAYLFQSGALLAWKTVAENVALPLQECTSLDDAEIDSKVNAALEAVELSAAADKYPSEISGGMQKRAGLARAIVRDTDIVLYDEPTSGLDPVTAKKIDTLIVKLARTKSITSIVVTHDLRSAINMADRILLLSGGKAVVCLPPKEFLMSQNPKVKELLEAVKGETI